MEKSRIPLSSTTQILTIMHNLAMAARQPNIVVNIFCSADRQFNTIFFLSNSLKNSMSNCPFTETWPLGCYPLAIPCVSILYITAKLLCD